MEVCNNSEAVDNNLRCPLLELPVEILYYIFNFVDARTIVFNLRLVCKKITVILSYDGYWKARLRKTIGSKSYPIVNALGLTNHSKWQSGVNTCWRDLCYHTEREAKIWDKDTSEIPTFTMSEPHYGSIDAIKLINNGQYCITGGRDRILAFWDLTLEAPKVLEWEGRAHQGWIWDIKGLHHDCFYSADWNGTVVRWCTSSGLKPISQYIVKYPALALSVSEQLIVVGKQHPKISLLDPRIGMDGEILQLKAHRLGVMDVCLAGHYVVSVSEDKTMAVSDIRAVKRVTSITISSDTNVPVSIAKCRNVIYIADNGGKVSSFLTNLDFQHLNDFKSPHDRSTSIFASMGSIFLASRNQYFTVITPTIPVIVRKDVRFPAELCKVDYEGGMLVLGRSDRSFTVYKTGLYD